MVLDCYFAISWGFDEFYVLRKVYNINISLSFIEILISIDVYEKL